MSQTRTQAMLCTAVDLEEKGRAFYSRALAECREPLAQEVFQMLRDDEKHHIARIKEIAVGLSAGKNWDNSCTLSDPVETGRREIFRKLAATFVASGKPCTNKVAALTTGIEFELALVDFYEKALTEAQESKEQRFLERMIQEERGHFMLLSDLQSFYDDPEAWSRNSGRGGLDGA